MYLNSEIALGYVAGFRKDNVGVTVPQRSINDLNLPSSSPYYQRAEQEFVGAMGRANALIKERADFNYAWEKKQRERNDELFMRSLSDPLSMVKTAGLDYRRKGY